MGGEGTVGEGAVGGEGVDGLQPVSAMATASTADQADASATPTLLRLMVALPAYKNVEITRRRNCSNQNTAAMADT